METKKATSFRLSPKALSIIKSLSDELGISQTSVLEMAVRDFAAKNNIEVEVKDSNPESCLK